MEKIFLDTNVILDLIQEREGADNARKIVEYSQRNDYIHIYVSYLSIANSAYILRKRTIQEIKSEISSLFKIVNILPSGDMQIMSAMKSGSPDFEDALQIACAEEKDCDLIITRNPDHFRDYTEISVLSPEEFVRHCGKAR